MSVVRVPDDQIEQAVGAKRDDFHIARVVTEHKTIYILHSAACKSSTPDLRDCSYSKAMEKDINADAWVGHMDRPVAIAISNGYLLPVPSVVVRRIPPEGWLFFGTLIEYPGGVEFHDELDEALMPLWERPRPVTVNDPHPSFWDGCCWICGSKNDHDGVPHGEATGDGLTRHDIVAMMGDRRWRLHGEKD